MTQIDQKYTQAYEGILTQTDLEKAAREANEYAQFLKQFTKAPVEVTRKASSLTPNFLKSHMAWRASLKADKQGQDYRDVAAKLNGHQFILSGDGHYLDRAENAQELSDMFPQGCEDQWPTLVLTANSNLTSPQSFFDSLQAAAKVVPKVTGTNPDNVVVAGTYFSRRNFNSNAVESLARYTGLDRKPEQIENLTPAAQIQAYQLLDLLLDRDENGAVWVEEVTDKSGKVLHKPVLRPDAAEVMQHVVCYGYSAAHMVNKDAVRALRDMLLKGDVLIHDNTRAEEVVAVKAIAPQVKRIMEKARLIGLAGVDNMKAGPKLATAREVNFIHPGDVLNALNGSKHLKAENVIKLKSPDGSDKPLETRHAGHDQQAYVAAFLDPVNEDALETARSRLGAGAVMARN